MLALAQLRVPPPAVVLANAATGGAAAWFLGSRHFVLAALLLQAKTVLDNADGQLARMTGRTSVLGRYLDSESDLLTDAAVCAALGYVSAWWVGALAFTCLTLVLSVNFNAERLHRGVPAEPLPAAAGFARALQRFYAITYAPQDRLVERFAAPRPGWPDALTVQVLANLGLSTQLAVLGACLAAGAPSAYAWFALGCAALLIPLAHRRR